MRHTPVIVDCAYPREASRTSRSSPFLGALLTCLAACAVGNDDGAATTFGDPTHSPTTTPSETSSAMSSSEDDGEDPSSTTADEHVSTTEAVATGDETSDEVPPEQPATGMYSHCLDVAACVGLTTCFTVSEGTDEVDGFCTRAPCVDPTTDCDPSPGGSSTPTCFEMVVAGMSAMGCGLDCSGGKTCPAGMQCYTLAADMICV